MTRFNLENAIATWRRQFRFNRAFLDQDIDELEWHVRDQVSALVARGNSEREAFQTAVNEMGLSVDAAGEYRKVFWTKLLDQRALMAELRWRASMLSNYLKLAYRNLSKNPGSSIINIVGLSVAVAATIVVYLFLQLNLTMDAFHENADRIYMVGSISERDGSTRRSDRAPMPLGALLESDFPQVEQAVRVENGGQVTVKLGDIAQEEALWFVDPGFLELFTFPLSVGDPGALTDKDAIILSADAAERFFGSEPALGRPLVITFNQSHTRTFMVRGVAEPLPDNASFRFNLLVNFELGQELGGDALDDWRGNALATFVLLRRGADSRDIESAMLPYQRLQNAANEVWPITEFTFTNLRDVAQNAHKASVSIARASNPATLIIFPLIALFLIALSCLNYVNIAMSQALRRVREIGLRKVLGGTRPQLIAQFLAENVLLSLMALVLGGVFASLVLLPGFNALFEDAAPLSLLLSDNGALWATLATILLVTGLLAGAFPALRLAAGNPAVVLSGNRRSKREGSWFASGLLGIQFVVAFTSMTAGLVFYQNAQYQTARDWGYSQEQTLVIRLSRDGQFEALADKFSANANANVLSLSGSIHHVMPRGSGPGGTLEVAGQQADARRYEVGHKYTETMGLRLSAGRALDSNRPADASDAILINQALARGLNLPGNAIGQLISIGEDSPRTVIGVVEDFHEDDFSAPIRPAYFRVGDSDRFQYLVVRVAAGTGVQTEKTVSEAWAQLYPGEVYNSFFQDAVFERFYRENKNITNVLGFAALMALMISCMGLFGLVSQNTARRMKEITMRKVLGASVTQIATTINRRFVLLLVAAAVAAGPITYVLLNALLASMYEYHMALAASPFLIGVALVFATALVTMSSQLGRLLAARPAEVLRRA